MAHQHPVLSRRAFFGGAAALAATAALPTAAAAGLRVPDWAYSLEVPAWAQPLTVNAVGLTAPKALHLRCAHTQKAAQATFWDGTGFVPEALATLDREVMRDWRQGVAHTIAPSLYLFLHRVQEELGHTGHVEVLSGYRTRHTNCVVLGNATCGGSWHGEGMAVDIRLPGAGTRSMYKAARRLSMRLKMGGVGLYTASGFIHLDVGTAKGALAPRTWGS